MPVYEFKCPNGHVIEEMVPVGRVRVRCTACMVGVNIAGPRTRWASKIISATPGIVKDPAVPKSQFKIRSFLILAAATALGIVTGAVGEHSADTARAAVLAEQRTAEQALHAKRDLAAIGVRDCGKMVLFSFIRGDGSQDIVMASTPAQVTAAMARMAALLPGRTRIFTNHRPCGLDT